MLVSQPPHHVSNPHLFFSDDAENFAASEMTDELQVEPEVLYLCLFTRGQQCVCSLLSRARAQKCVCPPQHS